jgi:uncharacterized protein YjbI with pentapeptide repeats
MKFEILNRHTKAVQFVAEIDCAPDAPDSHKKRSAVLWALENGADLRDANLSETDFTYADLREANLHGADLRNADFTYARLSYANLAGADLSYADLSNADLSDTNLHGAALRSADLQGANLDGADLSRAIVTDADLQSFKDDIWQVLDKNPAEVTGLLAALNEGRVNGAVYIGACACLVGTIANLRGVGVSTLTCDAERPAERWFMMIAEGDTPETCFASAKAVEWIVEWMNK